MALDKPGRTPSPLVLALVAQHDALTAYVQRWLPPPLRGSVDPADVVQDVCYDALRRESAYDPTRDPTARRWLFTIARRRLIRLLERHFAAGQLAEADLGSDDPLEMLLAEIAVYERTPSQSAASHETWAAVTESLSRLSADHEKVIRSRYLDRLSTAEVARLMERPIGAIEQLLHRAMRALRVELLPLGVADG